MNVGEQIGQTIEMLRKRKGWTQSQLADAIGVSRTNIVAIEQGLNVPKFDRLDIICRTLDARLKVVIETDEGTPVGGGLIEVHEEDLRQMMDMLKRITNG